MLAGAAAAMLAAPTLLFNASRPLAVGWAPAADVRMHYHLELAVSRRGRKDAHVSKQLATERTVLWPDVPQDARCCFRVVGTDSTGASHHSDPTCLSTCFSCAAPPPPPPPCASCGAHALTGVIVGAVLVLAAIAAFARLRPATFARWLLAPIARVAGGEAYSHLTTREPELAPRADAEGAGSARGHGGGVAQLELAPLPLGPGPPAPPERPPPRCYVPADRPAVHAPRPLKPPVGAAPSGVARLPSPVGASVPAITLEQYPDIDAPAFERQWAAAAATSRDLSALIAAGRRSAAPDEAETYLSQVGLACIAAGAVDGGHKAYFAGRTLGSAGTGSEWIMLELVFQWDGVGGAPGRVRATFRSDSNAALSAAARHFAESLGRTLGVAFGDGV